METFRLKNIILLILLLVNGFLAATLLMQASNESKTQARLEQELQERFRSNNVRLSAQLPTEQPPAAQVLTRDSAAESALASALLGGSPAPVDDGGGVSRYQSSLGQAVFYVGGRFSAAGTLADDGEQFCRRFCRAHSLQDLTFSLDEKGSGSAQAVPYYEGLPVANAPFSFLLRQGTLISVTGTVLPSGTGSTAPVSLDAVTALSLFLEERRQSGAVVSAVTQVDLCYWLESSSSSITLTPAWRITTDTVPYYVNCSTGAVSRD